MTKQIHTEKYWRSNEACAISIQISEAILPLINKYRKEGYSIRDLQSLAIETIVSDCEWLFKNHEVYEEESKKFDNLNSYVEERERRKPGFSQKCDEVYDQTRKNRLLIK